MSTTMQLTGIGVGDLQDAAAQEAVRIIRRAKGDRRAATVALLRMLRTWDLVTDEDLTVLERLNDLGFDAAAGTTDAETAYVEARRLRTELVVKRGSPVALALASADVGSYISAESDDGHVVYKKSSLGWQATLASAGAAIGGVLGDRDGAILGGAIGGIVGKVVDDCLA
ncbi:hypothetical protein [Krasilnikoviella flava]|uniref:Glycine zipper n=1 Tax=Krasilnikoviella flava TaxID=526729 RepID=A0A1T5JZC4_9MICO|nr:hypothetical protein [Krasilnikoviella flava]SKC56716.1 hypothetical protein SAMN04324258_1688 [Krasilnikoviella flava]